MKFRASLVTAIAVTTFLSPAPPTHAAGPWRLSFSDDFNGTQINDNAWSVYGKGGPNGDMCRDAKNVVVGGGMVTLKVRPSTKCKGFTTSGMCACPVTTQTFGKFEVRMKATTGDSKITFLLWAEVDWPPEIDFAEFSDDGDGADRQHFSMTLHYGKNNTQIHSGTDADMTQWHTVGVEWSPARLAYTLDGVPTVILTSHVPDENMWMALQTGAHENEVPIQSADTYIDWVHVYDWTG
jgi:beta-glucanase (GH16 family)